MMRIVTMTLVAVSLSMLSGGCVSRMVREGMGVATGASGKVVAPGITPDLTGYSSLRVEPISVAPNIRVPSDMPSLLQIDLTAIAAGRSLAREGQRSLVLSGQIIHYETAGVVDTAIGPLEEAIVRAQLTDAQTGTVIAHANLIGRSKAVSSSGPKSLSEGVGKAMDKWLKAGGLRKAGEKE